MRLNYMVLDYSFTFSNFNMSASRTLTGIVISIGIVLYLYSYVLSYFNYAPVILWYTPLIYPHVEDLVSISCKSGECVSTVSRSLLGSFETQHLVLVFYGTDFNATDLPFHRPRREQLWALLHEESPMNNYLFSHSLGIELFNYTATFRRESDFPLTTLYIPNLKYLTDRQPVPVSVKNSFNLTLAPIVYIQSNCDVPSDRDEYVSQLSNYIAVDSYGKCLHNKDLPSTVNSNENLNDEEFLNIISKYKFHLVYENAVCNDYMSEKLFRALHVGSVPIYKGSPTIRDWVPSNNSVIFIDDFSSPAKLATFLNTLIINDTLYENYLTFKTPNIGITNEFLIDQIKNRKWGTQSSDVTFVEAFECFLCDQLIERYYRNEEEIKIADDSHFGCPSPTPSVTSKQFYTATKLKKETDALSNWISIYWQSLDKAKSILQKMDNFNSDSVKKDL